MKYIAIMTIAMFCVSCNTHQGIDRKTGESTITKSFLGIPYYKTVRQKPMISVDQ